jgi:hypothetical protein
MTVRDGTRYRMALLELQQMGGVCGSFRFDDSEREGSLVG